MKLQTGHWITKDVAQLEGRSVRFMASDERCMFEVTAQPDGRSIEIRGVDTCLVDGILYSHCLDMRPQVANSILVLAREYDAS